MQCLLRLIAWLIVSREAEVWYRIDRLTQMRLADRERIAVERGVDAVLATDPYHALTIARQRNPMRPNQLLQAVFAYTQWEHGECIRISMQREREIKEFSDFMGMKQGQAKE